MCCFGRLELLSSAALKSVGQQPVLVVLLFCPQFLEVNLMMRLVSSVLACFTAYGKFNLRGKSKGGSKVVELNLA